MNKDGIKQKMIEVCERNILTRKDTIEIKKKYKLQVVFYEPYIPYIPDNWNGFLILAEAQNLPKKSKSKADKELPDYIVSLKNEKSKYRILRLEHYPKKYVNKIGIGPWDDNSLKLAFASVFRNESIDKVSVSNAVLWSVNDKSGKNTDKQSKEFKNLSKDKLIPSSIKVWKELVEIIKPEYIITAGKIAEEVIDNVVENKDWKEKHHIIWKHPSPNFIGRISNLFDVDDLLKRYHEVDKARKKIHLNEDNTFLNKVFYACHAVSVSK